MNDERGEFEAVVSVATGRRDTPLLGTFEVPGDKSITHRALFFGAVRQGVTIIRNPSPALDCRSTLELLRALGYQIADYPDRWEIEGANPSPHPYQLTLDCGNSGTTARLAAGFLTGEEGEFILVGDESLSRRPMERVAEPLRRMGGNVTTTNGSFPVAIIAEGGVLEGRKELREGGDSESGNESKGEGNSKVIEVRSAQVQTSLVLAAARSQEVISLRRTKPMRDHTFRLSPLFGITIEQMGDVDLIYPPSLRSQSFDQSATERRDVIDLHVPGDPSSAAFLITAALLVPGSGITIANVGLNPTRITFLETVLAMGGTIEWHIEVSDPEPIGTIRAAYSPQLQGIAVGGEGNLPVELMMDELPLLALLGSQAEGETVVRGAEELRLKESDRIAATVSLLGALGIHAQEEDDGFRITGPQSVVGGCSVNHQGDHRLAMLAGVAGLIAEEPVMIPSPEVAAVSWPDVWKVLIG